MYFEFIVIGAAVDFCVTIVAESFHCPCCKRLRPDVSLRRRNTRYVDEMLNWLPSCEECYAEDYAYYADLWDDFYCGCL